jgi:SRSO17 transposase
LFLFFKKEMLPFWFDTEPNVVRDYVIEQLAADDAVLVIDETSFLKQSQASCGAARSGTWTRGPLILRKIANGELAFFSTWCPAGTSIEQLVLVEGQRWAIEDGFDTAINELGLDHNETRSWHGSHRHVSPVMLAFAMMASIRRHANNPTPKKSLLKPGRIARRH